MDDKPTVKVSVCVVTYNQKNYIQECLDSLINQQVCFNYEIIVGDDASTDGTAQIVADYAERYPSLIIPILRKKNIGPYANYICVHSRASGEYIAHVDGDDIALPGKLQIQVDFLDKHPECNIVFHRVKVMNNLDKSLHDDLTDIHKIPHGGYTRSAILRHISVGANSSKMYRSCLRIKNYPNFNTVDYYENVEQVGSGKACFVNDQPYGIYRANIGISSSGTGTRIALHDCLVFFAKKYPKDRKNVNAAAFLLLLADLKNMRPTWRIFFTAWIKTFHPLSVIILLAHWKITRMLRLPF